MKQLLKGNEAIAESAIRAGCDAYFGYPITPQTELLEHMAKRMPELKRAFLQAESEVAAINMVYGAASTGMNVMTSSSSPGVSLMMEGLSYIIASEVPAVIVDVMRGGPGLGNIAPSQADYFQIVKGGGHGDYHPLVLAPATVQEAIDLTYQSFELAEKYRTVVVILLDGSIGQMMEPAELPPMRDMSQRPTPSWALRGKGERPKNVVSSIYLVPEEGEAFNKKLQEKLALIRANEIRYREYFVEDAEYLVIGFGTSGRVAQTAVKKMRARGIKVGLFRPISLYPFPEQRINELAHQVKNILVVEMNAGQMVEDVRLAVNGRVPVRFYGRMGGTMPFPDEIEKEIRQMVRVGEDAAHTHINTQNELGEWQSFNDLEEEVEEVWR